MAEDYVVRARFVLQDDSEAGVKKIRGHLKRLEKDGEAAAERIGKKIAGAFDTPKIGGFRHMFGGGGFGGRGMFGSLLGGAGATGALLGGYGVSRAVRGMVELNSEIQVAEAGLATLFNAQTGMQITSALGLARSEVQALRQDAAVGVGELSDYLQGYQRILGPGLAAGGSVKQLRELNRQALAAGFALRGEEGLRFSPMDVQQALTRGVDDRNTPFAVQALQAIGMDNKAFNALSKSDRLTKLLEAFATFGPGVELMGKSWDAQMGTFRDNLKEITRTATKPLFDRWTEQLRIANDWLKANYERVMEVADVAGSRLVAMWDTLIERAGTYAAVVGGVSLASHTAQLIQIPRPEQKRDALGRFLPMGMKGQALMMARLGAGAVVAAAAVASVMYAWKQYPEAANRVTDATTRVTTSLTQLHGQFMALVGEGTVLGTVLGQIGRFLLWNGERTLQVIDALTKGVSLLLVLANALLQIGSIAVTSIGNEAMAMLRGDFAGAQASADSARAGVSRVIADAFRESGRILSNVSASEASNRELDRQSAMLAALGMTSDDPLATGDPKLPLKPDTVVNIGSIEVKVASEVNADPDRVAYAFNEVLSKVQRYHTSPRRTLGLAGV